MLLLLSASLSFAQLNNAGGNNGEANMGEEEMPLFIANAFSPNNDGVNDEYYNTGPNFVQFEFSVFDRWGNRVFFTNEANFRWNGTSRSRQVPTGIYVFVLNATSDKNVRVKRSGTISVVR